MKKALLFVLIIFSALATFSQNQTYILTVKVTINSLVNPAVTNTVFIKVPPTGASSVINGTANYFSQTQLHETEVAQQINSITTQGYQLIHSNDVSFGAANGMYYLITRYIFKQQ